MLKICGNLFKTFNDQDIDYVIVKSVERISLDTSGKAQDIDLLISQNDKVKSEAILNNLGFKKVLFPSEFDGLGFYIGYDTESQKQILLHIHNKLRIGKKKYKELHLKLEPDIFKTRVFDKENLVYTTSPSYEFSVLLVRMVLRKRHKEDDIARLNFLIQNFKVEDKNVEGLIQDIFGKPLAFFKEKKYTEQSLGSLHKEYAHTVKRYLSKTGKEKSLVLGRILNGLCIYILKIVLHLLGFPRYIIRRTGKLVAFQGVDGSGKSTQIETLLGTKYLQMTGLKRMYGGNNEYWMPGLKKTSQFFAKRKGLVSKIVRSILSVFGIIDRRMRMIPAFINMLQCKLVIFDRYFYDDLSYLPKMNASKKKPFFVKRFAKKIFMSRLGYIPHLTVFLDIDANDAYKRKQDYSFEKVKLQIDAYREILRGRKEVKVVDASKTKEEINRDIMEMINGLI